MYQRKNPLGPPSGATTPDGSPGDIYVRANAERQDRALRAEVSGVGSVLEMGCGVGSLLERIELLGVEVHGVGRVDRNAVLCKHSYHMQHDRAL